MLIKYEVTYDCTDKQTVENVSKRWSHKLSW